MKKSEVKNSWETPQWLFDKLNKEYNFCMDVAASAKNTKVWGVGRNYTTSALLFDWKAEGDFQKQALGIEGPTNIWCNPPYGRGEIEPFVRKAIEERDKGATTVMLLPASTDTDWWHKYVLQANQLIFLKGRIRFEFEGAPFDSARAPSVLAVFDGQGPEDPGDDPEIRWEDYRK